MPVYCARLLLVVAVAVLTVTIILGTVDALERHPKTQPAIIED